MTWQPDKLTRQQLEERRRAGFKLLKAGRVSQAELARQLGVSDAAVSQWKTALETRGLRGANARRASGRPGKLTREQCQALRRCLKRGACAAGFPTERWTQARIQQVIRHDFGVTYHPNYIGRLMRQLGWSVQKPATRARERDEDRIQAWVTHDWPRIKKGKTPRRRNHVRG